MTDFEKEVIDRLARIETNLEDLKDVKADVETLKSFRNKVLGITGIGTLLAGAAAVRGYFTS